MREAVRGTVVITRLVRALATLALILASPRPTGAEVRLQPPDPWVEQRIDPAEAPASGWALPEVSRSEAPALLAAPGAQSLQPGPRRPAPRLAAPLGAPAKISAPLVTGGDVQLFLISPDGSRVVYTANQDVDNSIELYSVPISGGLVTQLNAPLVALGGVVAFAITADSTRVVYRADQEVDAVSELYSVPIGGGAVTKLNGAIVPGGFVQSFVISPDSSRVVYAADQDTDDVNEIYSVPITGGPVTKINGALVANGDVQSFGTSTDGARAIYRADQDADEVMELYSVPIAGGVVTKINGALVANGDVLDFLPVLGRTYYRADQSTDDRIELYSVPDSGGAPVKLNGPLVAGGNVTHTIIGVQRVVYRADQALDDVFELYSVPTTGGTAVKLNPTLVAGGDVGLTIRLPNDQTVIYQADQDVNDQIELYRVPATGGVATKLNGSLIPAGDLAGVAAPPSGTLPGRAVYFADQESDEVIEIYGVPQAGGAWTKLNDALVGNGDVSSIFPTATGILIYRADQDFDEVHELWGTTTAGVGPVTRINVTLEAVNGDVPANSSFSLSAPPVTVVYRADQDTDDVIELYSVFLDGDADGDGVADGLDCLAFDGAVWDFPGEPTALELDHSGSIGGTTTLSWTAPALPGGTAIVYDTVRSSAAGNFVTSATCVETNDGSNTSSTDTAAPPTGGVFFYLVRAQNVCSSATLGMTSAGALRTARECP